MHFNDIIYQTKSFLLMLFYENEKINHYIPDKSFHNLSISSFQVLVFFVEVVVHILQLFVLLLQ